MQGHALDASVPPQHSHFDDSPENHTQRLEEVTPLEDILPKKGAAVSSSAKKRLSDQRGTLRSERLYQTHKDKQEKWVEKRKQVDYERHKECSFRPLQTQGRTAGALTD